MPLKESEGKVLLALLLNGDTPIMTLPKKANLGGNAVYNSIRWLSERSLVEDIREKGRPGRRIIKLTEKGKRVAELLLKVEHSL